MSTTVSATPKRVRIPYTMTYIDCTCDATEKHDCTCIQAIPAEEKRRMRMEFRQLTPDQVEELLRTPVAALPDPTGECLNCLYDIAEADAAGEAIADRWCCIECQEDWTARLARKGS